MGIRYDGLKLYWLNQRAGTGVTITWTSPGADLGSFYGNETVSIPLKTLVINGLAATYSLVSGTLPGGLTINGSTLSGRLYNTAGSFNFTIRATSGTGFADQTFTATVNAVQAPVWVTNSGAIGSAYETTNATITLAATDPQDLPLTYSLVAGALPASLVLNTATGVLSGTLSPVGGDTMFSFTIAANNALLATNRGFSYTVKSNTPPEWITTGEGLDGAYYLLGTAYEGSNISYPVQATNFQGDETLTYNLVSGAGVLPDGVIFDAANAVITGTLPVLSANTKYTFVLNASDGVKSSQRNFEISVLHDYAPVWDSSGILAVGLGGSFVNATVHAHDVNGNAITYALDANSTLPGTITFDAANATLAGNLPYANTTTSTYYFNLIANNSTLSTTRNFGVTAQQYHPIVWDTPAGSLGTGVEGDPFYFLLTATTGSGAATFTANTATLPPGFSLNSGGAITGTFGSIENDTTYTFDVTATDGILPATRTFSISELVNVPPVWVTPAGLLLTDVSGYGEDITLTANDTLGRVVSYTLSNGALPPGLILTVEGEITGKMALANSNATYNFVVTASNGSVSNAQSFSIISERNLPPVWTTNSGLIGNYTEQTAMTFSFAATDPEGYPVSYSVANALLLPPGLTLNSDGTLSGKAPAEVANTTFNFTVLASDGAQSVSENFSMTIINASPPIWVTSSPLANAVSEVFYTLQFVAEGAVSFDVNSGTLPAGLTLYSNGVLSGTPLANTDTNYSFTLDANNGIRSSTSSFSLTTRENEAPTWNSSGALANALGGSAVNVQVSATDRNGLPITYALANGTSFPTGGGFSMTSAGFITGTLPIVENGATFSFTLSANNGYFTSYQNLSMIVQANQPPTWETAGGVIGTGIESMAFSKVLLVEDPENLAVSVTNTTPMPGTLTITVTADHDEGGHLIVGTNVVTVAGILPVANTDTNFPFTLSAYDGYETSTRDFSIDVQHHVAPVWTTNAGSLGNTYSGETFGVTLVATSPNSLPLTYALNASTLPGTLTLGSGGTITGGLPIDVSNTVYSFTVTVSDGTLSTNRTFSINNMPNLAPVWVTSNASAVLTQYESTNFSVTFVATDPENRGVTYALGTNNFPSDVHGPIFGLTTTGILTGTLPAVLSDTTYTFTVEAFDYENVNRTDRVFTMVNKFDQVPVWITAGGSLGSATEATSVSYTVVANAGADTVSYAVSNGALPSGLTLNPNTGVISGTLPTVVADTESDFTITASDTAKSADQDFSITTLLQRPPQWTTPAGPVVTQFAGNTINATVVATSPNGLSLTYTEISDSFPVGISFNPNTQIVSGTLPYVSNTATYPFEVSVSDGSISVTRTFDVVNEYNPAPTWTTNAITNVVENTGYSFALNAVNTYTGTVLYAVTNGTALPTGLTLNTNSGVISGKVANAPVDNTTTVTFSASNGFFANYVTLPMTVKHNPGPTFISNSTFSGLAQVPFSTNLVANNPLGLSVTYSNSTPIGENLSLLSNGLLYGTFPAVSNSSTTFTAVATDAGFVSNTQSITVTVLADQPPVWVTNAGSLGSVLEGASFTYNLAATDPQGLMVTYSLANGTIMPPGLSMNSGGHISGRAGSVYANTAYSFAVAASDGTASANQNFSVTINFDGSYADPFSNSTTMLLNFEGTVGSNAITDYFSHSISVFGNAALSNTQVIYGNTAMYLPDTNSYITSPNVSDINIDNQTNVTVEFWFYPTDNNTTEWVINQGANDAVNTNTYWGVKKVNGAYTFSAGPTSVLASPMSLGNVTVNAWQHIAISKSGTTYRTYNNGVWIAAATGGTTAGNTNPLQIGNGIVGYIDDFRITQAARYSTNANFTPTRAPTPPLWITPTETVFIGNEGYPIANSVTLSITDPYGFGNTVVSAISGLPYTVTLNANGTLTGTVPQAIGNNYTFVAQGKDALNNLTTFRSFGIQANALSAPSALQYSWRFNDVAGGSVIGPMVGNATMSATGAYAFSAAPSPYASDYALQLQGQGLYANTATNFRFLTSNNATVEGWFFMANGTALGSNLTMLSISTAANQGNGWRLFLESSGNNLAWGSSDYGTGGANNVYAPTAVKLGQWNHIAVTKTNQVFTLYLNGVPGTPITAPTSVANTIYDNQTLVFNGYSTGTGVNQLYSLPNLYLRGINFWNITKYSDAFTPTWNDFTSPVWDANSTFTISQFETKVLSQASVLSVDTFGGQSYTITSNSGVVNGIVVAANGSIYGTMPSYANSPVNLLPVYATDSLGIRTPIRTLTINTISAQPTWNSNGSVGFDIAGSTIANVALSTTDPQGLTVSYSLASGSLPSGISLTNTGILYGSLAASNTDVVSSFVITATNTNGNARNSNTLTYTSYAAGDVYYSNTSLLHADGNYLDMGNSTLTWSNGALANTSTVSKFGTGSFYFSGAATGYVRSTALPARYNLGTGNFTFECWANVSSLPAYLGTSYANAYTAIIMSYGQTGAGNPGNNMTLSLTGTANAITGMGFQNRDGSGNITNNGSAVISPSFGQWNHYAWQRSNGTWQLFVNGGLVANVAGSNTIVYSASDVITLGALTPVTGFEYPLQGYLDEIRFTTGIARYPASGFAVQTAPFGDTTDPTPIWTSNGSLGSALQQSNVSVQLIATELVSNFAPLTYTLSTGSIPNGITLASNGLLSGVLGAVSSDTISTFTVKATAAGGYHNAISSTLTYTAIANGDQYYGNVSTLIHAEDTPNSTVLTDSTGKQTYTLNGDTVSTAQKKFGNSALYFVGNASTGNTASIIQSQINPTSMSFTGDFTVEAWVYANALTNTIGTSQYRGVIAAVKVPGTPTSVTDWSWCWYLKGSTANAVTAMYMEGYNSGGTQVIGENANITFSMNTWHHVAVVRNSGNFYFFLDGVVQNLSGSTVLLGSTTLAVPSGATLQIGGITYNGYAGNFNGYIDELRITNGTGRYNANFTVASAAYPNVVDPSPTWSSANTIVTFDSNTAVIEQLSASNTSVYTLVAGNLPNGVIMASNGLVTGFTNTVANALTYNATVQATYATDPVFVSNTSISYTVIPVDPNFANVALLMHGDGNLTDSSGTSTPTSAGVTTPTFSHFGTGSMQFVGAATGATTSYLRSGTIPSKFYLGATQDFTFEAWVNMTGNPNGYAYIASYGVPAGGNTTHAWNVYMYQGNAGVVPNLLYTQNYNSAGTQTANTGNAISMSFYQWNHVALSRVSGTNYLFFNGTLIVSAAQGASTAGGSTYFLQMGAGLVTAANQPFTGYMDEIRYTVGVGRYTSNFVVSPYRYSNH